MILLLILAAAMIVLGGIYAAGEAAIMTAPRALIEELAEGTGSPSIRRIAADPPRHASASSFLRVISETGAAAAIAIVLDRWLPQWWMGFLGTILIMLVVSFLLVGSSPRALGRNHPTGVLRWTAGAIAFAAWLIGPIGSGLSRFGGRVAGAGSDGESTGEEYLLNVVDRATEFDVLEDQERDLIHQVVEFGDTIVREVMVPRTDMITVEVGETLGDAMGSFLSHGVSRMPVVGDDVDQILGVLYLRDVAKEFYEHGDSAADETVRDRIRPGLFMPESLSLDHVMRLMRERSVHLAIVIDEYGGVAGLATMEDVIEELLGSISDESDHDAEEVIDLGGGRYRVSARLGLDEIGELFDLDVEDEDVDSVGGLFQKAFGKMATPRATVTVSGLDLIADVVDQQTGRIQSLIVSRAPAAGDHAEEASS